MSREKRAASTVNASEVNFNSSWVNYRGAWIVHIAYVVLVKLFFASLPGISRDASWTLTLLSYNAIQYFLFHWAIGVPYDFSQGEYQALTLWEQIDYEAQFTPSRKFLLLMPVALFLLTTHYSSQDWYTFFVNFTSTLVLVIAKLPFMHKKRLFGINQVDLPDN